MELLGVYMPHDLKQRIKSAAKLERRVMSDWVRITLEDAAREVIARHNRAELKVAEDSVGNESSHSIPAAGAAVKYPQGRTRKA